MNTTAVEPSADFGLLTIPAIFGWEDEAFERLQKLTHLNLAVLKAMLEEGQTTLPSSLQSGLPPVAGAVGLLQRFAEHTLSYSAQLREIDSQFMAAVTRAGEDLRNQYNAIGTQIANVGQPTPFGSDAATTAMQSAIGDMMRAQGITQETSSQAAGARTPHLPVPDIP